MSFKCYRKESYLKYIDNESNCTVSFFFFFRVQRAIRFLFELPKRKLRQNLRYALNSTSL